MKKIKIFLGAYINAQNAQNINCLALAKYLDKGKFDVYTMENNNGSIDIDDLRLSCHIIHYDNRFKFTKIWKYIYALYKCDILYLPKQEKLRTISFLNKLFFKKTLFLTIESIIDDYMLETLKKSKKNSLKKYLKNIRSVPHIYSITKFIKHYNYSKIQLDSKNKILYLGINSTTFSKKKLYKKKLQNIIFIGNDMLRKGVYEYINLAKSFPNLTFHIVGKGVSIPFNEITQKHPNIKFHGSLNPDELNTLLQNIDLHILPSKSEGFPKVILETASVGIPSIVYSHYGADEWMTHEENGFIVDDYEDIKFYIQKLYDDENILFKNSKNALKMAKKFDWSHVVKDWEKELIYLYNNTEKLY